MICSNRMGFLMMMARFHGLGNIWASRCVDKSESDARRAPFQLHLVVRVDIPKDQRGSQNKGS
jgi:hypothetical protein